MPADKFAEAIISEMKSAIGQGGGSFDSNTPIKANQAIAKAITNYLTKNTKIVVSYSGVITSTGLPDPLVADTLSITGECKPPGTASNFETWILELGLNIQNGFFLSDGTAGIVPTTPSPCFVGSPLEILGDDIKQIHISNLDSENLQKHIWEFICDKIITWLNIMVGAPYTGENSKTGSVGAGASTKTIVS